jgi:hypothetical protein
MKLEAVIRSIKASSWKNTNDVGVTDEDGHFRYLATITYYPEVIEFDVVGVCTYSFLQSDFSTRRQMVAHVKRFVAGWILLNQKWCNWAITDSKARPVMNFSVDGKEPFFICDSWVDAFGVFATKPVVKTVTSEPCNDCGCDKCETCFDDEDGIWLCEECYFGRESERNWFDPLDGASTEGVPGF